MITVDLDMPGRFSITQAWHRVRRNGTGRVEGRVSASGTGVHIRDTRILPAEVPENHRVRRHCGDDPKRTNEEAKRSIQRKQVLWDTKGNQEAGPWVSSLDTLLKHYERNNPTEQYIEAIETDYQ